MEITVIGNKSSNKIKLLKNIKKAIDNIRLDELPEIFIRDDESNNRYKNTPVLVINQDIISEGKVLSEREISRFIKLYAN